MTILATTLDASMSPVPQHTVKSPKARKALEFIMMNYAEELQLDDIASYCDLSKYALIRVFHQEFGISPAKWLWMFRAFLAREFIKFAPQWDLTDIAFSAGFSSSAHFSRSFRKCFQQSPSAFKKEVQKTGVGTGNQQLAAFDAFYGQQESFLDQAFQQCRARAEA